MSYGTPTSALLQQVREAGFKPIGITVLLCEETFIFKNNGDAQRAAEQFLPEGWWYGLADFRNTYDKEVKKFHNGDEDMAPLVYWLDENFAPKKQKL